MIPVIKKILYATDLSKNSSSLVFSYAVDLARKYEANIIILHSVESTHNISSAGSSVAAVMRGAHKQEQEESLDEIKKRIEAFCQRTEDRLGVSCVKLVSKILIPLGNPAEQILKAAEEEACDVLVLGVHKQGFLTQAFLGWVARSVLERSRRPIFFVPLPSEKAYESQDSI